MTAFGAAAECRGAALFFAVDAPGDVVSVGLLPNPLRLG